MSPLLFINLNSICTLQEPIHGEEWEHIPVETDLRMSFYSSFPLIRTLEVTYGYKIIIVDISGTVNPSHRQRFAAQYNYPVWTEGISSTIIMNSLLHSYRDPDNPFSPFVVVSTYETQGLRIFINQQRNLGNPCFGIITSPASGLNKDSVDALKTFALNPFGSSHALKASS